MDAPRPPAYAWDWFARQRLLWRESRRRLVRSPGPTGPRYAEATEKGEVILRLREDYAEDAAVRDVVDAVVAELAFLGRTDVPFREVGSDTAPRGLRWWWTRVTGEVLAPPPPRVVDAAPDERQLRIEDIHEGYGDGRG